jgi:hypothetical protein
MIALTGPGDGRAQGGAQAVGIGLAGQPGGFLRAAPDDQGGLGAHAELLPEARSLS